MITFDYTKDQLKRIQCGLYALKAGNIPIRDYGICLNLENLVYLDVDDFLQPCFETWKHFSGDYIFPVPSPYSDNHSTDAATAYRIAQEDDMWNPEHPYGSLRLDLLEHLIRECEDAIDNGGYINE